MKDTPVLVGGAYLEPQAYELLHEVLTEIFASDLGDVVDTLRLTLFRMPGVLRREQVAAFVPRRASRQCPTMAVWRLTDDGETLLSQLLQIVRQPMTCADMRRREIAEAIAQAGFSARVS